MNGRLLPELFSLFIIYMKTPHKSVWGGLGEPLCYVLCMYSIKDDKDGNCPNYSNAIFLQLFNLGRLGLLITLYPSGKSLKGMTLPR